MPHCGHQDLQVEATGPGGQHTTRSADAVLAVAGVRPDIALATTAGAALGTPGCDRRGPADAHQPARHLPGPATASPPGTGCWARPGCR